MPHLVDLQRDLAFSIARRSAKASREAQLKAVFLVF
jgi:hypothetical protein